MAPTRHLHPDDLPALRYLVTRAFGVEDEAQVDVWVERGGADNWRIRDLDSELAAAALRVPMGIWFGGRSVSNLGFSGVGVVPAARARGVGFELIADMLREAQAEGTAVTTLYPSTREFYRKLGFELAGDMFTVDIDLSCVPPTKTSAQIVRLGEAHRPDVVARHDAEARGRHAELDRGPYLWRRVEDPHATRVDGYGILVEGQLEGYAYVSSRNSTPFYNLRLHDWCASTPEALRGLLHFLRSHRSLAGRVEYFGAAGDALTAQLPARSYTVRLEECSMLRLLNPAAAFGDRGYQADTQEKLTVSITEDAVLPSNAGAYRLEVSGGRAEVLRLPSAGSGVRGPIQGISALYAGYLPARALAQMGWIEGDEDALARAERIFGRVRPVWREMF